jgi:hypothetical protein
MSPPPANAGELPQQPVRRQARPDGTPRNRGAMPWSPAARRRTGPARHAIVPADRHLPTVLSQLFSRFRVTPDGPRNTRPWRRYPRIDTSHQNRKERPRNVAAVRRDREPTHDSPPVFHAFRDLTVEAMGIFAARDHCRLSLTGGSDEPTARVRSGANGAAILWPYASGFGVDSPPAARL